jgi:hypothetical protein
VLAYFQYNVTPLSRDDSANTPYYFEATYFAASREEQILEADAVFIGRVARISSTKWNQDSGEYWEEEGLTTLPYHEVQVNVIRSLLDEATLGDRIDVTVLGASPAGPSSSSKVVIASEPEHSLQVGDVGIFFVVRTELAWRGGVVGNQATRPIIRFIGYPEYGYLRQLANGQYRSEDPSEQTTSLDQVIRKLRERGRS